MRILAIHYEFPPRGEIVKESDSPRHKRSTSIRRLFRGYMVPMDILVYTPSELKRYKDMKGSFAHKVLSRGRILYG